MKPLKINISILILIFINFIFLYKYVSRYTEYGLLFSIILVLFQYLIFKFSNKIKIKSKLLKIGCYGLFVFIIGLIIISHLKIPLESLMVDRWSVISSFLTEFYNGNYPYFAKSHRGNYPGPMPIYYLVAAPFQYIGELSILSALGYCVITALLINNIKRIKYINFLLLFSFTTAVMIWEITTRSNIFTFTTLIVLLLNETTDLKDKNSLKFYGLAILTGFLLSTRSVYILPYVIFFLSSLTNHEITFKRLFLFLSVAVIAFATTFMPFIYFYYDDFFKMNPFIIQSSFLIPTIYTIGFIIISIILSFVVKTKSDKFFYSGMSLFIAILIYAIYYVINYGYTTSYINSKMDISYFIFCIPFFIKYLIDIKKNDKITPVNK